MFHGIRDLPAPARAGLPVCPVEHIIECIEGVRKMSVRALMLAGGGLNQKRISPTRATKLIPSLPTHHDATELSVDRPVHLAK